MDKNKPKLLYVITQGQWGGAQKYVYDLSLALREEFEIIVAVGEPNDKPDLQNRLKKANLSYIQLRHLRRAISPWHDLLAIFELRGLYRKLKPSIVHLNSSKAGILGSLACQMSNVKCQMLVYTVHGWVFNEPLSLAKKKLYKLLQKITARAKSQIIVLSESEKQTGLKLGIPEKKITTVPLGVGQIENNLSKADARRMTLNLWAEEPPNFNTSYLIGTIANFYPTKNLDNLIKAVSKIKNKLGNFYIILIGDGPEREKLQLTINHEQLTNFVHLPGFVPNAAKYLPAFDIFVLPSRKEGLPYTLLEAQNAQTPIIATDVGAVNTIVSDKKTGLLAPPEDVDKLAQAIEYAYNNREEMKKMAQLASAQNSPKYSKSTMILETVKLYRNMRTN